MMLPFSTDQRQVYPTWNKDLGLRKWYMIYQICFLKFYLFRDCGTLPTCIHIFHEGIQDKGSLLCCFSLFLALLCYQKHWPPFNFQRMFFNVFQTIDTFRNAITTPPPRHCMRRKVDLNAYRCAPPISDYAVSAEAEESEAGKGCFKRLSKIREREYMSYIHIIT